VGSACPGSSARDNECGSEGDAAGAANTTRDLQSSSKAACKSRPKRKRAGSVGGSARVGKSRKSSELDSLGKMRTQSADKPFACKLCDYKCTKSESLKTHMRIHHGETLFACELCNFTCKQRSGLKPHMRIHTGEKPFACELCDYKCNQSGGFNRHMRMHAGKKIVRL